MTICPYSDFKSGEGFATHIGVVGVTITFYDVQTKVTTSRLVEIPVAVTYVA
jgi:hypothetical protein